MGFVIVRDEDIKEFEQLRSKIQENAKKVCHVLITVYKKYAVQGTSMTQSIYVEMSIIGKDDAR